MKKVLQIQQATQEKLEYKQPILKEHGSVEEVTLQTFFGTFSPPPPTRK